MVKYPPAKAQEMGARSLGQEDPLEEEMATHSGVLAWEILWREEPGGLQSMGSQRVGHDWASEHAHGNDREYFQQNRGAACLSVPYSQCTKMPQSDSPVLKQICHFAIYSQTQVVYQAEYSVKSSSGLSFSLAHWGYNTVAKTLQSSVTFVIKFDLVTSLCLI